jgi:hypothetical protein
LDEANAPITANTSAMSGIESVGAEEINEENIVAEDVNIYILFTTLCTCL